MKLLKKYSNMKLIDGLMAFVCVLLTITTIVFLFHREWFDVIINAMWAVIAWRNYQLNVRNTTAREIIEWQDDIIDDYKELVRNLTYKCDIQDILIKELEKDSTLIINGKIKGTDGDGGVKGEKGEEEMISPSADA